MCTMEAMRRRLFWLYIHTAQEDRRMDRMLMEECTKHRTQMDEHRTRIKKDDCITIL